jgi:hypothetical protein
MTNSGKRKVVPSGQPQSVDSFLSQVARVPAVPTAARGRLIFAMDATASREPTWREARRQQSAMFDAAAQTGGLSLQLCYYRGLADFSASSWLSDADTLKSRMGQVECVGGYTQIVRLLEHALEEARRQRINAVVFIGDCVEENPDILSHLAGQLGVLNTPLFLFQEGHDANADRVFRQLAQLSGGAHCRFDAGSADQLRQLLGAIAAYASGGFPALERYGRAQGGLALQLTHQLGPSK